MADRRAEAGAADVAHGQQRDLVVEVDEALDDHAALPGAPAATARSPRPASHRPPSRPRSGPCPSELITGLTMHGKPSSRSGRVDTRRACRRTGRARSAGRAPRRPGGGCPRGPWSAARRARSESRVSPPASSSSSVGVAMASISGTTRSGRSSSISARSAAPSSMSMTWLRCATCIAGALRVAIDRDHLARRGAAARS